MTLLLLGLYLLVHYSRCGAQNVNLEGCPSLATFTKLTTILNGILELQPGDGFPANVIIEDYYINCLSIGNIQGYHHQATYTVHFTGEPGNIGSTLAQMDIIYDQSVCLGIQRFWKLGLLKSYNKITVHIYIYIYIHTHTQS